MVTKGHVLVHRALVQRVEQSLEVVARPEHGAKHIPMRDAPVHVRRMHDGVARA